MVWNILDANDQKGQKAVLQNWHGVSMQGATTPASGTAHHPISSASWQPQYSDWISATIGICLSSVILVAIGGNVLVCIAILTDRKLKKVSNYLLISLAIADLVVSCLVMPFAVANDILGYWPFATEFCNVWISFDILSTTASILHLCAISLDRYIHMKKPFYYTEWMNTRKCLIMIGIIWLASLLISFLPINLGWHQAQPASKELMNSTNFLYFNTTTILYNATGTSEGSDIEKIASAAANIPHCSLELNPQYAIISSSISFYIPCIVMVAIYIQIYKLARHHAKNIERTQAFDFNNRIGHRRRLSENKALFTLGMIMGLFLVSWIPFFIVNLVSSFCKCVPDKVFIAFTWLGYCNSVMNPIIYSKFNADFRHAFRKILCCDRCRDRDPYASKTKNGGNSFLPGRTVSNGHRNGVHHSKSLKSCSERTDLIEMENLDLKEDLNDNFLK